jgi:hypothetical protein
MKNIEICKAINFDVCDVSQKIIDVTLFFADSVASVRMPD